MSTNTPLRVKLAVMAFLTAIVLVAAFVPTPVQGVTGKATHYCLPGQKGTQNCTRGYGPNDMVAAIDRKDSSFRKGDKVVVTHGDKSIVVTIVDVCACKGSRVIDLTSGAFRKLAPLSRGVISVTLSSPGKIALPATDTESYQWRTHL